MQLTRYLAGSRSVAAACVDRNGRILWANRPLENLAGRSLRGTCFTDVVAESQRARVAEFLAAADGEPLPILVGVTAGREAIPVDFELAVFVEGGERLVVAEPLLDAEESTVPAMRALADLMNAEQRRLFIENRRLEDLCGTDPLTGIANRRALAAGLGPILEAARSAGRPMAAVMIDLDHLKAMNDLHGHEAGDLMLETAAKTLRQAARATDLVTRYGGDEFLVVLADCSTETAGVWAERARRALREARIPGIDASITGSFGVAPLVTSDTPESLLARADRAMYKAKERGRDGVVVAALGDESDVPASRPGE
jgi:diguanylate cyclase (GGDEF)-like protein